MGKKQRGRWSTKVNVLKQDRIIFDEEGYDVGFHDSRYHLGKYTVKGFGEQFYKDYEQGYKDAYGKFDSKGYEKGLDEYFGNIDKKQDLNSRSKNKGCLAFIFSLGGVVGLINLCMKVL
ncbi:hypothetical protein M3152_01475 [Sporosarcina luteola]|uniref:hypothetical protein n=1 Tax=Sporosarcina luteola TaxID=582850 RepID=UPI00203D57A0|nr:hypothetical protein [Sporosarcina luteola]MCM3636371.1 hypothetical protein [Sporosarcina luteola]